MLVPCGRTDLEKHVEPAVHVQPPSEADGPQPLRLRAVVLDHSVRDRMDQSAVVQQAPRHADVREFLCPYSSARFRTSALFARLIAAQWVITQYL